jgi:hypothetical protein
MESVLSTTPKQVHKWWVQPPYSSDEVEDATAQLRFSALPFLVGLLGAQCVEVARKAPPG